MPRRTLADFIDEMCQQYNIDESHGLKHSVGTMIRARAIMDTIGSINEDEREMVTYAAALHDLCDSKYTDSTLSSLKIKSWLILDLGWSRANADSLVHIVNTISYSKLRKIKEQNGVHTYPNHGKWQRSYHIVRQADILESFIPARCVLYNMHKYPEKSEDEHWRAAWYLFHTRVFNYVKDGWITIPGALAMVPDLEKEARRCLVERSMGWP
jgi:hypothetical protein